MIGVPGFISNGPWWGIFLFLCGVVFFRAQGTYFVGRWLRGKATAPLHDAAGHADDVPPVGGLRQRLARRLSGPGWTKAQRFLDRWGFVGIPLSFLTVGFQTLVNAAAGFTRMRWDLYTLSMIPGCLAWAAVYATVGLGLFEAWRKSPLLFAGIVVGLVATAWLLTRLRTARERNRNS